MKKRILSLLLVLAMAFTMLPAGVFAQSGGFLSDLSFGSAAPAANKGNYYLDKSFSSDDYSYKVFVPDDANTLCMWATLSDSAPAGSVITATYTDIKSNNKKITVTSNKSTGAKASDVIAKSNIGNVITISVGTTGAFQTYSVSVVRKATLSNIAYSDNGETKKVSGLKSSTITYSAVIATNTDFEVSLTTKEGMSIKVDDIDSESTFIVGWNGNKKTIEIEVSYLSEPSLSKTVYSLTFIPMFNFSGEGTEENPYLINDIDDFISLRDCVNAGITFAGNYLKLTSDITLPVGWIPIGDLNVASKGSYFDYTNIKGSSATPFSGIFDGDGHTITVPSGELTAFGFVKGATLKKYNIYGEKIPGYGVVQYWLNVGDGSQYVVIENVKLLSGTHTMMSGFIGGYASGKDRIIIRNCSVEEGVVIGNKGDGFWDGYDNKAAISGAYPYGPTPQVIVTVHQDDFIGSFIGAGSGEIINCSSSAIVYGRNFVGGIWGMKGQSMGDCYIRECSFDGEVIAIESFAGGILGAGYAAPSAPNSPCASIQNCVCYATVSGINYVGGICSGEITLGQAWNNGIGYIQNNFFGGKIKSDGTTKAAIVSCIATLDSCNVISNNYYLEDCGAEYGIIIDKVDSSAKYAPNYAISAGEGPVSFSTSVSAIDNEFISKLNSGANSSSTWKLENGKAVLGTEKHIVSIANTDLNGMSPKVINSYSQFDNSDITVTYNDGTVSKIKLSDCRKIGWDFSTVGYRPVQLAYNNAQMVFVLQNTVTIESPKVNINLTVSNKGELAKSSDGALMANANVIVEDINGDGVFSVDEALIAAHKAYMSEADYETANGAYGLSVTKLWGESTYNALFFVNGNGLSVGVGTDTVKNGDSLIASINADNTYYADWYTKFDKEAVTVKENEAVNLTLTGHLGMAYMPEDLVNVSLPGITVKTNSGDVLGTTNTAGAVSFSFSKAGTYYVTANGTVSDEVDDYSTYPTPNYITVDCPIIAPVCIVTVNAVPVSDPDPESDPEPSDDITVYFTVLGDTEHGDGGNTHTLKNGGLITWVARRSVTVAKNSSVWAAMQKLSSDLNGVITYTNPTGNYFSAVTYNGTTLGEFDNGSLSGWMYTLNGSHPNLGVSEQKLKAGDEIVIHYTDDYTKEEGSEVWDEPYTPPVSDDDNKTETKTEEKKTEESKASDNEKAPSIEIKAEVKGEAKEVNVAIPADTLKTIAEKTDATVYVQTPNGNVAMPTEALNNIVEQAGGADIQINVETKEVDDIKEVVSEKLAEALKDVPAKADGTKFDEKALENATAVEFNITAGDKNITSFGGNKVEVSIPVDKEKYEDGKYYRTFILSKDGSVEATSGKIECGNAKVGMGHFSTVIITTENVSLFLDVKLGAWYESSATKAYELGLMNGVEEGIFGGNDYFSRAMVVAILYKLEGSPEVEITTAFADVKATSWYAKAVSWAAAKGIVSGANGKFYPNDYITREELALVLKTYTEFKKIDTSKKADISKYADSNKISKWAMDAIAWANAEGLMSGYKDNTILPKGDATRSEAAVLLINYIEKIK